MKIVIAGAGFGGLRLARKLNNKKGLEVTLVDRFNYHQFQPLFYQVATGGLDASNISFPLRKIFQRSRNVRIRLAEIRQIMTDKKVLVTDAEKIPYDILVLATGADTHFYGNASLAQYAFPMKSTVEALQLRYRLLQNFEKALTEKDPRALERLMQIVVVGGGPTGVEVAGALAEMKRYILPREYPELDSKACEIWLLEGTGRTLPTMSENSSERSVRYLEKLGVRVRTNTMLKEYNGSTVQLSDGTTIESATVIWAAGIKGNIPNGVSSQLIAKGNRIITDRLCRVKSTPGVYAIGDLAYMETPKFPAGLPQVAPVAMQQADQVAAHLLKLQKKGLAAEIQDFEYRDRGSMATVGRNLAVVDLRKPRWQLGGLPAWMIWMGLHLMMILGVKNRFFVFCNWLYNYITYDQHLRLIFRAFEKPQASVQAENR